MKLIATLLIASFPFIPQTSPTNCGAAVSAMVVSHYAEPVSPDEFYQGLSGIRQIQHNLERYGVETERTEDPEEAIIWGMLYPYHWVVIYNDMVYDPMEGVYPLRDLEGQGLRIKGD